MIEFVADPDGSRQDRSTSIARIVRNKAQLALQLGGRVAGREVAPLRRRSPRPPDLQAQLKLQDEVAQKLKRNASSTARSTWRPTKSIRWFSTSRLSMS